VGKLIFGRHLGDFGENVLLHGPLNIRDFMTCWLLLLQAGELEMFC
jgi:hypothetical protein